MPSTSYAHIHLHFLLDSLKGGPLKTILDQSKVNLAVQHGQSEEDHDILFPEPPCFQSYLCICLRCLTERFMGVRILHLYTNISPFSSISFCLRYLEALLFKLYILLGSLCFPGMLILLLLCNIPLCLY